MHHTQRLDAGTVGGALGEHCRRTRIESTDECITIQTAPDDIETIAVGSDLAKPRAPVALEEAKCVMG